MFIYEKNNKLNVMIEGGKPAKAGQTPNIVIEPDKETDPTKTLVKIFVDGEQLAPAPEPEEDDSAPESAPEGNGGSDNGGSEGEQVEG